ncbi:DUF7555 family protein [Halosolutus gelatinilyticus]|uniref:DUF7555 family protein n=1 Tax=Halosolutus gelatinilyticus TaxID=2931975 RepID=UPI001FF35A1F|nr:hypothetical protein [Halosolutus gelatinilyticus]
MPPTDPFGEQLGKIARTWADALAYALVVAALTIVGALALGIATGGGVVRAKLLLFIGGWALLSYATVRLWPTSIDDASPASTDRTGESLPGTGETTRFQTLVSVLPPGRWIQPPPPEDRMTTPGKLLVGSLLVLLVSFLMETALGVT